MNRNLYEEEVTKMRGEVNDLERTLGQMKLKLETLEGWKNAPTITQQNGTMLCA